MVRYVALLLMAAVLLGGYWKTHPLPSLVVPLAALVAWSTVIRRGERERWLFFYVAGIYLYTILRAFADDHGFVVRSEYVINVDRFFFMGTVPSVELQRDFFQPWDVGLLDLVATGVHWSFFVVPHAAFAFLWVRHSRVAPRYAGAVLLTLYIGLVLFWLMPTVPPWLAAREGDLSYVYRVMDFVMRGVDIAAYDALYETLAEPNSVAAVPSIHMALTFLVLLQAREVVPRLVWPLAAYNLAMAFSLVYLGEHYVFDVAVGVAVATLAARLLRRTRLADAGEAPAGPERLAA